MKQTKFFLWMLAALLVAACSDDDSTAEEPAIPDFADYSNVIGMSYSTMIRQYPNPALNFGDFYMYEPGDGKVESLTIALNSDTQTVYMVLQVLAGNAYKEADIEAYFASKYYSYGKQAITDYDDDGNETKTTLYSLGNTEREEDATLTISVTGNSSVTYLNPQNVPQTISAGFEEITPIEAARMFMGADIEDVLDEYGDALMDAGGMYMAFMEENPYLSGLALIPDEDGIVTSVILLYNEDLTDEAIIDYYREAGYAVEQTGTDGEGSPVYLFTDEESGLTVTFSSLRGVAAQYPKICSVVSSTTRPVFRRAGMSRSFLSPRMQ